MINVVFHDHVNSLHCFRHWHVLNIGLQNPPGYVSSWKEAEEVKKPFVHWNLNVEIIPPFLSKTSGWDW